MRKIIILLGLFLSNASFAMETNIWLQHGLQLHQSLESDDQSVVFNNTFVGITISHYFVFGQNLIYATRSNTTEASSYNKGDFSLLELGPRVMVFFNQNRNLSLSLNYNPYCKGTRKIVGGSDQTVDGTSFNVNLSLQLSFWQNVYLGASLNFHQIMLSTGKVGGTESNISDNYSYLFPAFEFSVRF
jgi:hypothetical protein